jgi:hypothetical protein
VGKLLVSSERDVGRILAYVHDRHFQLSDIHFDRANALLSIPLTVETDAIQDVRRYLFFSRWKCTVVKADLVIRNVTDFALKDDAQVGEGAINTIEIGAGAIVIACALPVEIRASVSRADIELMLSDEIVGTVPHFSFGAPRSEDIQQTQ